MALHMSVRSLARGQKHINNRFETRASAMVPLAPACQQGQRMQRQNGTLAKASVQAPTTDESVPEGHKGLHATLYDQDAAAVHADSGNYRPKEGEDDGSRILPAEDYLQARDGVRPPGVFALYDQDHNLQYVGFSRNIVLSIKTLRTRMGSDKAAFVRALVVANQAMQTRSALQKQAQTWLDEADGIPPGNGPEADLWGSGSGEASIDLSAMSPAELAAYEEKKFKLRKAMGEGGVGQVEEAGPVDPEERRQKLINAMEGGDWSAVIDGQTRATLPASTRAPAATVVAAASADEGPSGRASSGAGPVASPFAKAGVHRKIGEQKTPAGPELTVETVIRALEEVRPYLQADGGDVEVVAVADGVVSLRLEGACSTCAASSATLKMGIERALSATFGEALKGVVQVDKVDTSATVASVDDHLNIVRPAIKSMGGAVEVVSVEGDVVTLKYKGPAPLAKGLVAAVKDKFPQVKDVTITSF